MRKSRTDSEPRTHLTPKKTRAEGSETATARKKRRAVKIMWESRCNITEVCEAVGITRSIFYKWRENDPQFAADIEACYEHRLDIAEKALQNKIDEGSETSLIFFLKTQGKSRGYVERTESNVNVEANVTAKISAMSDDELKKKLDELQRKLQ